MVPVPVPTFEKLRFRFRLLPSYGSGSICRLQKAVFKFFFFKHLALLQSKLFHKEKIDTFHQIYCKMWVYCVFVRTFVIPFYYGSGTVINYGSDSNFWQVTVPVPQGKKLRFLRFRFHNTVYDTSTWDQHKTRDRIRVWIRFRIRLKFIFVNGNLLLFIKFENQSGEGWGLVGGYI